MPKGDAQTDRVCYCTNVHPGRTPSEILAQLDANDPRPFMASNDPEYRVGLWLSDAAAAQLDQEDDALDRFAQELESRKIRVLTLNGFPQHDFHQPVVKHAVYHPNWASPERLEYTLRLARVLVHLIPEGTRASISTLPIGWPTDQIASGPDLEIAARLLVLCAQELAWLAERTGRTITLDLEPEPGCVLDTAEDVLGFFNGPLDRALATHDPGTRESIREHLGVCHDVCHSAVMHEDQREAMRLYAQSGIRVHKVQVSSAVAADLSPGHADETTEALRAFDEPRYLHQTTLRTPSGTEFFEDLGPALASTAMGLATQARVHFHVPIFAESVGDQPGKQPGKLGTTRSEILPAIQAVQELHPGATFELETYAWPVLPTHLQPESLARGIAAELDWFARTFPELHP
ncbi:MAG: sugar phosphate isomerase/epimerase [Phycisphaerales bacterium]|jgi:sugar phosphate isomerase/epimerase